MNDLHFCVIPIDHLAFCGDCLVAFNVSRRACPKCASEIGWAVIPFGGGENEAAGSASTDPAQTGRSRTHESS